MIMVNWNNHGRNIRSLIWSTCQYGLRIWRKLWQVSRLAGRDLSLGTSKYMAEMLLIRLYRHKHTVFIFRGFAWLAWHNRAAKWFPRHFRALTYLRGHSTTDNFFILICLQKTISWDALGFGFLVQYLQNDRSKRKGATTQIFGMKPKVTNFSNT